MTKFKKSASILLMSTLMLSLAACGKANNNAGIENSTEGSQQEAPQQEVTLQEIEANMIGVGSFQKQVKEVLGLETIESIYTADYQETAQQIIDGYKADNAYTLESPLFILNPYGTNRTGVYAYFNTETATNITYTVSVEDENIADFTATMFTNEEGTAVTEHEGQIIGLIQGYENTVTFEVTDENGTVIAKTQYKLNVPDFGTLDKLYFEVAEAGDVTQLADGLFTVTDYDLQDKEEYAHTLLVDNTGVIRAELILDAIKMSPTVKFIDNSFVYPSSFNQMVFVNNLGKVERFYDLGQYKYHHDMEYNAANNTIAILADDSERDTIEEIVISLDLETGDIALVADFNVLMADIYERATRPESNMMYGTEFDWIHFNSIVFINDTDVLLSSRELSSVIRVDDLYENPTISCILADELVWADTAYSDLVYTKGNEFVSFGGNHNLTVIHDDSLEEGQYYLTLYNNNWWNAPTWPEFDGSQLEGVNLDQNNVTEGNRGSMYYKLLVDDNAKTYTLVNSVELPYSSFVSNSFDLPNGNISFCSGAVTKTFGEYDSEGNVIIRFNLDPDAFVGAYRAMKLDYKGFWFN